MLANELGGNKRFWRLEIVDGASVEVLHINVRGASRAKLTQGAALKRNGTSLS